MKNNNQHKIKKAQIDYYSSFAKKCAEWPNKYNIKRQISKFLSDYTLLSKINLKDKIVLNIGCSEPIDELYWVNLVREWHSLDINENIIKISEKMISENLAEVLRKKIKFISGDATKMNLANETFDVVTAFSTIEHIPESDGRERAIKEVYRVLKNDGYFVITVPNKWDIKEYQLSKRIQSSDSSVRFEYNYSPIELKKLLINCGFKIIDCASTGYNPWSYFDRFYRKIKLGNIKVYIGRRFGFLVQKKI